MHKILAIVALLIGICLSPAVNAAEKAPVFTPISTCGMVVNLDGHEKVLQNIVFQGDDIVAKLPGGIHDPHAGVLVAGSPKISSTYSGVMFLFASAAHKATFDANPKEFMLPAGFHCLLAMSEHKVVDGNPEHMYFIKEANIWAIFGSAHGPEAMARMTGAERLDTYKKAISNYNEMLRDFNDKVAKS